MAHDNLDAPVLIVGAGPVGLTLALALGRHGVRSVVVERHQSISSHPRARFVHARSMEIFRRLGIEPAVRETAIPDGLASLVVWAPTLSAPELRQVEIETLGPASGEPLSPAPGICTSQGLLDPVLHRAVVEDGHAEVRFGWRLTALEQDDDGVSAVCIDEAGRPAGIRARYLVGADGARSTVRDLCGIAMPGPPALGHTVNIHFRADLAAALRGRPLNMAMILNPAQPGLLLNIDGRETWTAQAIFSPAAGQSAEEFDEERCREVVRAQVGDPGLAVEILGIAPWTSAARVAEHLAAGRVVIAGDAAQEMPPAGGFGMNTGIQEADNLAWKLAAVLRGWASPSLLGTYEEERLPLARWITEQALHNLRSVGRVEGPDGGPPRIGLGRPEFFRERGMVFGATYRSRAVVSNGTEQPTVDDPVTEYLPSTTPGCRAPHAWVEVGGHRVSTLDLVEDGFALVHTGTHSPVLAEAETIARDRGIPLRGFACPELARVPAYGLEAGGMVLIRPDGHVGWRAAGSGAGAADVLAALGLILGREDVDTQGLTPGGERLPRSAPPVSPNN